MNGLLAGFFYLIFVQPVFILKKYAEVSIEIKVSDLLVVYFQRFLPWNITEWFSFAFSVSCLAVENSNYHYSFINWLFS